MTIISENPRLPATYWTEKSNADALHRAIASIDKAIKTKGVKETLEWIKDQAPAIENADKFRRLIMATSFVLSDFGIAPRWQNLIKMANTPDQYKFFDRNYSDGFICDLYFLAKTFPNHITQNTRWQTLFNEGFNLALAESIANRKMNTCRKIEGLALTTKMTLCCMVLYTNESREIRERARKAAIASKRTDPAQGNTKSVDDIKERRLLLIQAAKIDFELNSRLLYSPTGTAEFFKFMTGNGLSIQNISQLIKKLLPPKDAKKEAAKYIKKAERDIKKLGLMEIEINPFGGVIYHDAPAEEKTVNRWRMKKGKASKLEKK